MSVKTKRKQPSKKVRFEVFKRDDFKCQYCGSAAPDVILHVDHIKPVSKGGTSDIMNLVTSCVRCNLGKGAAELDDSGAITKQRRQLEELNERREQLEMMLKWRENIKGIKERAVDEVANAWEVVADGFHLNENGIKAAKRLIRKYGLSEVLEAIDITSEKYIKHNSDGTVDDDSVDVAWKKVGGICHLRAQPDHLADLYYIRGILRNRLSYCNEHDAIRLLDEAHTLGAEIDDLRRTALQARNWTTWKEQMCDIYGVCG